MKNNPTRALNNSELIAPLKIQTKSGLVFDATGPSWVFQDGVSHVSIDFTTVDDLIGHEMLNGLRGVLKWYLENHAPQTATNSFGRLKSMLRLIPRDSDSPLETITPIDILNFRALPIKGPETTLSILRGFLLKWHELGYHGISDDTFRLLNTLRVKSNTKGTAVSTMDPDIGPYTPMEHEAILGAAHDAYGNGTLDQAMYLLALLFINFGARPIQYASMKVCDLEVGVSDRGDRAYVLQIPRAKQRTKSPRSQRKARTLISQIGEMLDSYRHAVARSFEGRLPDITQAPMFPSPRQTEISSKGFEFHHTGQTLARAMEKAIDKLEVISERTGKRINISSVRFRRTFGTNAAREGHGELVIAEMLDHSDNQSVGVYVAAIPEIAERIDRAVATQLAPLAQAFKGILIRDESEATRGNDPTSRIRDLRIDREGKAMGSCGQYSVCSFSAPIACYTCRSFEPWLDGPHEAVLEHLLKRREQQIETMDERIASINDRTILAVAQVAQKCREQRTI